MALSILVVILLALATLNLEKLMTVHAATTPSLGAAATYGVLASTYTNTSASTVNGDVGFTTGPAVAPGGIHTHYGSGPPYATAGANQGSALSALASQACTFTWGAAVDLSTDTTHGAAGVFTPGVYCSTGAMSITASLTLSGSGTYIFRAVGALNSTAGAVVTLTGGASACDVFWTPTGATTLGANTTFTGTVIGDAGITVGANTTWTGRALAFGGTVTTDTTTITVPTCTAPPATLHVAKQVVNNNGGTATASSFMMHVKSSGTDVSGSPAAGTTAPGTSYSLAAGTYNVSEDAHAAYAQSFSGDCDSSGNITLASSDDKTCTITNDDIAAASINVVKTVINDSGGTKTAGDFPLFVGSTPVTSGATNVFSAPGSYTVTETADVNYTQSFSGDCDSSGHLDLVAGDNKFCIVTNNDIGAPVVVPPVPPLITVVKVPSPLTLPSGPGLATYAYTVDNIGMVPAANIAVTDDTCSPLTLTSGDTNSNAILEVDETWTYTCSSTLSTTHTNNVIATGSANGLSTTDIASATVIVSTSTVPPLIHVTKIPSTFTLLAGGGAVTYTANVTNPGTAALSNVSLTDATCSPLQFISGDTNGDVKLDAGETWTYTCQSTLTATAANTLLATGSANGLTARDFAFATVTAAATTPKLPNVGAGSLPWQLIVPAGIIVVFLTLYFKLKSRY